MKGFFHSYARLIFRGLFMAGTLVVLLALAAQRAQYISYQMVGVILGVVIAVFGIVLAVYLAPRGRADKKDVVQFSRMDTEHGQSETLATSQENGHILSPEEARQWLDDFLVSQQKAGK